ncbi:MAG TPA: TlpA disulfide reductase family protein [Solirubrobacteraceae bacterium]|nr:TlpA disulfide reductase family protein [Solirubrobacteraceae bacterium]
MIARSCVPVLAVAALIAGCGTTARNAAPPAATVAHTFRGSPPQLASLHAQASELLGGGAQAFKARLAQLRGYPVVVNLWASWCEPCQSEFPVYQRVSVAFGRRVAFLGIDGKDQNAAARSFLHRFPVSYPSYTDPQGAIESAIQAVSYFPQTLYFNRRGTMVYDKAGPYLSVSELQRDISFYLRVR